MEYLVRKNLQTLLNTIHQLPIHPWHCQPLTEAMLKIVRESFTLAHVGYGVKLQLFSAGNNSLCSANDLFYFTAENLSRHNPENLALDFFLLNKAPCKQSLFYLFF